MPLSGKRRPSHRMTRRAVPLALCAVLMVGLTVAVAVAQTLPDRQAPPFGPKMLPEDSMPPYVVKFGSPLTPGYATLQEVCDFAGQMGGPGSPFTLYGDSGLVVGYGAWADGYYWVWISSTRASEVVSNSSLEAEIAGVVNSAARAFGYTDLMPVKIAVATGTGGYLPLIGP